MALAPLAAPLVTALTAAQTGFALYGQYQAKKAGEIESRHRQQILQQRAAAERRAMITNQERMLEDRKRTMASVRAQQAASGFTHAGTPLAVLGEIGSRYDEQINEVTSRSLSQIASYEQQSDMIGFAQKQQSNAALVGMGSTLFSGAYTGFRRWNEADDVFGKNKPFSLFRN